MALAIIPSYVSESGTAAWVENPMVIVPRAFLPCSNPAGPSSHHVALLMKTIPKCQFHVEGLVSPHHYEFFEVL